MGRWESWEGWLARTGAKDGQMVELGRMVSQDRGPGWVRMGRREGRGEWLARTGGQDGSGWADRRAGEDG